MDCAKAGWKVAIVERDKIGGTCMNVVCISHEAVASARTMLMARHAEPLVFVDGLAPE
jgi:probable pyridine nucleotide-disulfide oxidoreductase